MKKSVVISSLVAMAGVILFFVWEPNGSAKPSELVGSWRGPQGSQLTLREDGSVTAENVPTSFSDEGKPIDRFTGKGEWSLGAEPKFPKVGDQRIDVTLGETFGSKSGIWLDVKGKGASGGLSIPISYDTGKEFVFKKH
ncbi:hypothetical protein AB0K89_18905 [Streptomyces cinnamoneus]|uniref:hypothetical protein n=1 Tax=Streptomyces cinnamoneus TaxID=53446 RepID=UPI00341749FA